MPGYTSFNRKYLANVVTELKARFPGIEVRASGLTHTRIGHKKHYSFQYLQFAWTSTAEDAYDARAKAWMAYMNRP